MMKEKLFSIRIPATLHGQLKVAAKLARQSMRARYEPVLRKAVEKAK